MCRTVVEKGVRVRKLSKTKPTSEQRNIDTDLWIIFVATLVTFVMFTVFQQEIYGFVRGKENPILLRVFAGAILQYGLAGLGITIVCIVRKEHFSSYGLNSKGLLLSILLCILCFVPHIIFMLITQQTAGYLPFQSVWTTNELLTSGFPTNTIGMLITATAWGFFEGFNYVVISEKINKRYPTKCRWLNWGAITCAIMCILIHGAIGVTTQGFIEMLTIIIIIYGMLQVKEFTGNAWGCIFIFMFLWNAF